MITEIQDNADLQVFDYDSPDWMHDFIHLITLNICNGQCSNLNIALHTLHQMRVDLGILMETKIDNDKYMQDCCSYMVFVTHAKNSFQGGIALFYCTTNSRWWIEGNMAHGPNVISCVLISGNHHWNIIGTYIPPTEMDSETIQYINEAVQYHGTTNPYILLGDLNVDLDNNHDARAGG